MKNTTTFLVKHANRKQNKGENWLNNAVGININYNFLGFLPANLVDNSIVVVFIEDRGFWFGVYLTILEQVL